MNRTDCPSDDQLNDYAHGSLPEEHVEGLERHLEDCSICSDRIDQLATQFDPIISLLQTSTDVIDSPFLKEAEYAGLFQKLAPLPVVSLKGSDRLQPEVTKPAAAIAPVSPSAHARQKLGPYLLGEVIGRGGMGTVYKAQHQSLRTTVAVKLIQSHRFQDLKTHERFRREMEAASKILHPNVVQARDAGEFDGIHFLVMEFVDGLDLSALLKRHERLSVGHACEIVRMAAMGLQAIHQAGMVHRDLKPGNLMLARDGQVKILDLGLALLNPQLFVIEGELTESGQLMGTIDYMAPEQADDTRRADFRADIYGLGATLVALLTGKPPFGDRKRSLLQKLSMLANQSAPSLKELWPDAPLGLCDIVAKMLARDPANRFQSASDITTALGPFGQRDGLTELLPDRSTVEADFAGGFPGASVACTLEDTLILDRSRDRQLAQLPGVEERQRPLSSDDAGKRIRRWIYFGLILVLAASSLTVVLVSIWKPQLATNSSIVANADPANVPGDPLSKTRDTSVSSSEPDTVAAAPTLRLPVDAALAEIATTDNSSSIQWTIFGSDATPDDRADAIHLAKTVVPIAVLLKHYQAEARPSVRAGLLLAISEYDAQEVIAAAGGLFGGSSEFMDSLYYSFVNDPDAEVHSCLEFLLRHWGHDEMLERLRPLLEQRLIPFEGGWFRPFHISTMVVIPGPRTELLGPDTMDPSDGTGEGSSPAREVRIPYSFAIATTEVTRYQFWRLSQNFWETLPPDNPDLPVNRVRWNQAAEFCNRLTELDGMPASQQCYILAETAKGKFWRQKSNALELSGYRLPTDDEWEIACRAGSQTLRPFGDTTERFSKYVSALEQPPRPNVVGHRKPNAFGLFDMLGNVSEWIHTSTSEVDSLVDLKRLRGGSAWTLEDRLTSRARFTGDPGQVSGKMGFRVARTLVKTLQDDPKLDDDVGRLELLVGPPACTEELRKYVDPEFKPVKWKQVIRIGNWNVWTPVKRMLRFRNISADDVTFVDGQNVEGYFKFEPATGSTIKGHSSADFGIRMEPQGATGERSQLLHFWWGEGRVYDFEPFTLHGCFEGPLVDLFDIGSFDVPAKMIDLGILPMNSQAGRTCYVRNVGSIPVQVQVTDVRGPFKLESAFDKTLRPHGLDNYFHILIAPNATAH